MNAQIQLRPTFLTQPNNFARNCLGVIAVGIATARAANDFLTPTVDGTQPLNNYSMDAVSEGTHTNPVIYVNIIILTTIVFIIWKFIQAVMLLITDVLIPIVKDVMIPLVQWFIKLPYDVLVSLFRHQNSNKKA